MKISKKLTRILCGAGLAVALAVVPGTWALSSASAAPQNQSMQKRTMSRHSRTRNVDINTASASELKTLHGVGEMYAQRIIRSRPYNSKNDLVTKGVLPQNVYDRIRDQIVAHRKAR